MNRFLPPANLNYEIDKTRHVKTQLTQYFLILAWEAELNEFNMASFVNFNDQVGWWQKSIRSAYNE